jgi:DNA polymerase III subunit delta
MAPQSKTPGTRRSAPKQDRIPAEKPPAKTLSKAPVYLLLGPEKVMKRERVTAILKQHGIADDPANPARSQYFASDSPAEEIMSEITSYPFFGGVKAVIVHEAERLPRPALESYLSSPLETTVLILMSDKTKGKFSAPLERFCDKVGTIEVFWELFENQLSSWAENKARREYGLAIPPGLGALLTEICGRNMALVEQSLQILSNYFLDKSFALEEVSRILGEQRGSDIFALVAHCFQGQTVPAITMLRSILSEGESPIFVQSMLMRQAELLWRYHAGARTKESLGVQPMAFREIEQQSRAWSVPLLSRALCLIASLDHSFKSEPAYCGTLRLELAVFTLARRFA